MSEDPDFQWTPNHLHFHVGQALQAWANVERTLGRLFIHLLGGTESARAVYYTVIVFNARLDMTDAAFRGSYPRPDHLTEWEALAKRLKTKSKIRNKLAHFETTFDKTANPPRAFLSPSIGDIHNYRAAAHGKGTRWDYRDVAKFKDEFMHLYIDLDKFVNSLAE